MGSDQLQNDQRGILIGIHVELPRFSVPSLRRAVVSGRLQNDLSAIVVERLGGTAKAGFALGVSDRKRRLCTPYFGRRRVLHPEFHARLDGRDAIEVQRVQAHHFVNGIVENEAQIVEIQNRVQASAQVLKQFGEALVGSNRLRNFQQRGVLVVQVWTRTVRGAWPYAVVLRSFAKCTAPSAPRANRFGSV